MQIQPELEEDLKWHEQKMLKDDDIICVVELPYAFLKTAHNFSEDYCWMKLGNFRMIGRDRFRMTIGIV